MDIFEVRKSPAGKSLFALKAIARGTELFGLDDWYDEEERRSFVDISGEELDGLPPRERAIFLRYAYNCEPERIRGTFHPEAVRHPVNFINHSCTPNIGYDGSDHIVAIQDILPGEEIRMDYGTYSFSFDHDFLCYCGSINCRGRVRRNDWKLLVKNCLCLPSFMGQLVEQLKNSEAVNL